MFKHKNMSRNLKIIGGILFVVIIGISFSGCFKSKYVKYDDIDDIEFAEPTEYAKNFDLEGYINKLPEVEYEKVDYPVKETYTYKFNDYEMTIDIPEGFEAYEIPLTENPRIVNSTSIDDSCEYFAETYGRDKSGPCEGVWLDTKVVSDSVLCIRDNKKSKVKGGECNFGFSFVPMKARFTGASLRDSYLHTNSVSRKHDWKFKHITDEYSFIVNSKNWGVNTNYKNNKAFLLISDEQEVSISSYKYIISKHFSKDLFFSTLNSINITKK